jgi:VWFA-related protein
MDVKGTFLARTLPAIAAFGLLAVTAFGSAAQAAVSVRVDARPVAEPIQVFVEVTDSGGRPVGGLTAGDFTVSIDGTAVASPQFSLPPSQGSSNVSVVFALDMSSSVQNAALDPMRDAVTAFINSMAVGDYAAVVKFNNSNPEKASVVQEFTRIDGGAGNSALVAAVNAPYPGTGSNILDGVALSVTQLRSPPVNLPAGPKAVVLISDGRDNASQTTQEAVIESANQGNVPIFTIGVGDVRDALLRQLASGTGGQYLAAPSAGQIANAYERIARQLNNEYLLTFSSNITDCSSHAAEVRVSGHGTGSSSFTRCDSSGGGGGGGGGGGDGGGGGGGAFGVTETLLGGALLLVAIGRSRRQRRDGVR